MPLDADFLYRLSKTVYTYINTEADRCIADAKVHTKTLVYFKGLILHHIKDLYLNKFTDSLILSDGKVDIDLEIVQNTLTSLNNNTYNCTHNEVIRATVLSYIRIFCDTYLERAVLLHRFRMLRNLKGLPVVVITYLIRKYFQQVQYVLLEGGHYTLPGINLQMLIYGKTVVKKGLDPVHYQKVDWGQSLRYLKKRASELNPKLFNDYEKGYISKSAFINGMKQYNLKWHIYLEGDFYHWLVLRKTQALPQAKTYAITPNNFVRNATRSQIDFTNKYNTVEDIISTDLLGFRDKLRGLERTNMDWCLKTYRNDLRYNK